MTAAQTAYLNSLEKQLKNAKSCDEAVRIVESGVIGFTAMTLGATATAAKIAGLMAKPTDLAGCISWISTSVENYITEHETLTKIIDGVNEGLERLATGLGHVQQALNCLQTAEDLKNHGLSLVTTVVGDTITTTLQVAANQQTGSGEGGTEGTGAGIGGGGGDSGE